MLHLVPSTTERANTPEGVFTDMCVCLCYKVVVLHKPIQAVCSVIAEHMGRRDHCLCCTVWWKENKHRYGLKLQ